MPAPILVSCQSITKTFGARPLFERLTFVVHEGDHVALIGPNGTGKSTLIKILAGVEEPDVGSCTRRRNLRVGYVPQHPALPGEKTPRELVTEVVADGGGLTSEECEHRAAVALGRVGFAATGAPAGTLSGGWRTRLAIASAIALEPDLLLLDEPTNHLDLESRRWLEGWLNAGTEAFVVVSHDRVFLQNVGQRMLDLDPQYAGGLLTVDGDYADLLEAKAALLAGQASQEQSLANRVRREIEWLRRGPKARSSKAKARIDAAHDSIEELAESRARLGGGAIGLALNATERQTKRLWWCGGLCKSFAGRPIVSDLELLLTPGLRLGVVGANGSGKTTLLRLIVGELAPEAGEIRRADGLRVVYFDQDRAQLDPTVSLRQALAPDADGVVYRDAAVHVASWARRFGFRSEQLDTPVARLSGGERARVVLARLMLQPADLFVLDEPTNDLDIPTLEVLEEALLEFPGALVLVTHDRHLLGRISTTLLALDGKGGLQRFADYGQWEEATAEVAPVRRDKPRAAVPAPALPRVKRLTYLEQREWEGMEAEVLAAEARLTAAQAAAEDPAIATDAAALEVRLVALSAARLAVDRLYERWAELESKRQ